MRVQIFPAHYTRSVAPTRWLTDGEQLVWRAYLEATQRLWERLDRELDEGGGVSLAEYEVLARLSESPKRSLRMSELADQVVSSRSRLTHTVTRMESRGLVSRRPSSRDGRGVVCALTGAGMDNLAERAHVHVDGVREHLFDQMDAEETEVVGRVLARVAEHLRQTHSSPLPSMDVTARETLRA